MIENDYIHGVHKNTYATLFNDNLTSDIDDLNYMENMLTYLKAHELVDVFTKSSNKYKYYLNFVKLIFSKDNFYSFDDIMKINNISFDNIHNEFLYNSGDVKFSFRKLSDYLHASDSMLKELHSDKRKGTCHLNAIFMTEVFPNCKLVTGYVKLFNGKILHSVVEYNIDDKDYIVDYTLNIIMKKEDYNKLMIFNEISSYNGMDVQDDIKSGELQKFETLKFYVTFRDEILKNFECNNLLFNLSLEQKTKNK